MKEKEEEYREIPVTLRKIELLSPEKIMEDIYKDIPELDEDDLLPSPEFIFASEENKLSSPEDLFSKNKPRKKIEKLPNKKK